MEDGKTATRVQEAPAGVGGPRRAGGAGALSAD